MTERRVDYDRIAPSYDRRYRGRRYDDVERVLREWLDAVEGRRVLEVGCGTGHWLAALADPRHRIFGLDHSAGMLQRARAAAPGSPLLRADSSPLPFADHSVDALFSMNAFHHFPDKRAFVAEAGRVLAPGGELCTIGLDPHCGVRRWAIYEYFEGTRETDQARYPPHEQIQAWLRAAGFVGCASRVVALIGSRQPAAEVLASNRLRKDATSQLALLTDEAYERGVERIRAAMARASAEGRTLYLEYDLELLATTGRRPGATAASGRHHQRQRYPEPP